MLKIFYTNQYDNLPFIKHKGKFYCVREVKSLIFGKMEELDKLSKNIVIITGDNFGFIINFFAGIFTKKNIYLLTERQKLKYLDIEYSMPDEKICPNETEHVFPEIDLKTTIINIFTSGSTDTPKKIKKSLYNITIESIETTKELGINTNNLTVATSTTPCHMFGMTYFIGLSFSKLCLINTDTIAYPEDIDKENCLFISTPTFLKSFWKHMTPNTIKPKYIITAGAKLENDLFEKLEQFSDVTDIYGSTELGVIAYRKSHKSDYLKLFDNIKLTSDKKIITEYGYLTDTVLDDNVEIKEREIKILGRKDRLLKIYEKRVSAESIEKTLSSSEYITESYCFKHSAKLSVVCALSEEGKNFVLNNGITTLIKTLKDVVKTSSEILPQKWRFCSELPHTKTGKIDKGIIEHLFNVNISSPVILDKTIDENGVIYKLFFHKSSNFYKGHFPDFPITPGVVQLYFAGEFINYYYRNNYSAGQLKRIKFNNIIPPDSVINLKLEKKEKSIKYTYFNKDFTETFSSGEFPLYNIFEGEL